MTDSPRSSSSSSLSSSSSSVESSSCSESEEEVRKSLPAAPRWESPCGLSKADFEKFTQYMDSNNPIDNRNRAVILGHTQEGIKLAPGANVRLGEEGRLGKNVFVGLYSYVNGDVSIGDNVLIGPHCSLTSNTHVFHPDNKSFRGKNFNKKIVIGEGSWLAAGVMIAAGVILGKCNLVCANSVVTKDTPDYAIVAGTPAQVIGSVDRDTGENLWFSRTRPPIAEALVQEEDAKNSQTVEHLHQS